MEFFVLTKCLKEKKSTNEKKKSYIFAVGDVI
jgi:hypothetical protein